MSQGRKEFGKQEVYVSYRLFLNPCAGSSRQLSSFGLFASPTEARAFYDAELVPEYHDVYFKNFRKGGPLAWYNPLEEETCWTTLDNRGRGLEPVYTVQHPTDAGIYVDHNVYAQDSDSDVE